jgi:WS/DGAT/MGAT family acyltransferase
VAGRLHLVPKLRQRVRLPLVGESVPVWVDDAEFDIREHVRAAALPRPGTDGQLLDLCADLMSRPLDRDRPLWQVWLIDGLEGNRVALMEMLHHSMADGLAGVELATVLLDLERDPGTEPSIAPWQPSPEPGWLAVTGQGLAQWAAALGELTRDGWHAVWHPSEAGRTVARYGSALLSLLPDPRSGSHCSLNTRVGYDRRIAVVRQRMDVLRAAERRHGVTINDLLLTAIAGGVHDLLSARGEVMEGRTLQVLVPVGADHHGDHRLGNQVAAMVVRLPIDACEPLARLRRVAQAERSCKEHDQAAATQALLASLGAWPPTALPAASQLIHHQPIVNLVVTNVRGPDVPLYVLGARMEEAIPLVPLGGNLSVGVAALSYDGHLTLGILADPVACPDLTRLAEAVARTFTALLADPDRSGVGVRPAALV